MLHVKILEQALPTLVKPSILQFSCSALQSMLSSWQLILVLRILAPPLDIYSMGRMTISPMLVILLKSYQMNLNSDHEVGRKAQPIIITSTDL